MAADFTPGVTHALSPLVRRVVAPNPGPFTGPGTNTHLVGVDEVAVIDPGPDDRGHIDAVVGAAVADRVRWVLLTHFHPDHLPGTTRLVKATGAEVLAFRRPPRSAGVRVDRLLADGDTVEGTEFGLDVLHTPGHAPEHLCFLLGEERALFTGDTVLGGTWSVISPKTGGDMDDYLTSLARLERLRLRRIYPAHGDAIDEPRARIREYVEHRRAREKQILALLEGGPLRIREIVDVVYADQDLHPQLVAAARNQVHAHLLRATRSGKVTGTSATGVWSLA